VLTLFLGGTIVKKHGHGGKPKDDTPTTDNDKFKGIVFNDGLGDTRDDLLVNAAAVTRLLIDIIPAIQMDAGQLTQDGFHGLYLILTGIENTISAACDIV
jgi:hypothetical protein